MENSVNAWIRAGFRAAVSGTLASLAMTAALSALARQERRGALQPINATSHWLHGERAGAVAQADAAYTAVGYATHHASAWFWALLFERWLLAHPPPTTLALIKDAAAMSAVAAVVDYALVPKRLTPGWETVLSKRAIAATYAVMAVALAGGALLSQRSRQT
jgi:hypothetical protein